MTVSFTTDLGDLADPACYTEAIRIDGRDAEILTRQLKSMLVIRVVEEQIGDMVAAGKIVCPCHLGIGQEAIAVGVSEHLRKTDAVFGAHRSHSHYLALGGGVYELFAEVLGKDSGCSRGMGGSMHLHDAANGFMGSVPIVAGTIPLAAGAALAAKMDRKDGLAVVYFGDGAAEEGVVHETLNFASVFKLPLLLVCENNLFSSHLHISLRQPNNAIARFAAAHAVPYEIVDGNDIVAVDRAAGKLTERIRRGEGPGFLEAVTYRWRGHVGPREDIDVGVNRGSDLIQWKHRDPVRRLSDSLINAGVITAQGLEDLRDQVVQTARLSWQRAEQAPYPDSSALLDRVYAQ